MARVVLPLLPSHRSYHRHHQYNNHLISSPPPFLKPHFTIAEPAHKRQHREDAGQDRKFPLLSSDEPTKICTQSSSISRCTASAAAINALNDLVFLQLFPGHAADAGAVEVCFFRLYTTNAAKLFFLCQRSLSATTYARNRSREGEKTTFSYPIFRHFATKSLSTYPFFPNQSYNSFEIASFS